MSFLNKLAKRVFNKKAYNHINKYFGQGNEMFFKFVGSQVIDAFIVGILTTIAMSIIGVKYAPLLGFMIGLFNLIPYIGAIVASCDCNFDNIYYRRMASSINYGNCCSCFATNRC